MTQFRNTSGPKCFGTSPKKSFFDGGDKDIPGPGTNIPLRIDKIENPEWSFGLSQERNSFTEPFRTQYPSPHNYKPHFSSIQNDPIQYTIPKAGIDIKSVQLYQHIYNPDITVINKKDPIYSFGYSIDNNYETDVPGVGSYQLDLRNTDFNKTQHSFGTGDRPLPYGEEGKFPGPGKYLKMTFQQTAKYSFPKSSKIKAKSKEPLAKFYDIGQKSKAPKGNRFIYNAQDKKRQTMLFHHNENPAPNQYHTLISHKIPSGVIENSKRKSIEESEILKYPSPEKYSGQEILKKNRKGYSFCKNIRDLSVTEKIVPPPGTYEVADTLNTIGGAIGKQEQKKIGAKPTPGSTDYRPKMTLTKRKAQSTIVFRGQRQDFSKTITGPIGPGAYQNDTRNRSELGKIGRSQRNSMYSSNHNPGVGDYDISGHFGKLPKYYTSPKKINENGFSTFHDKIRMKIQQRRNQIRKENSSQKEVVQ